MFAFPYRADIVDAVRSIPGRRFDWEAQGVVGAARRRHRAVRQGRARAPRLRCEVAAEVEAWLGARGHGLGRARERRRGATAHGRVRARQRSPASCRRRWPRSPTTRGGRDWLPFTQEVADELLEMPGARLGPARAALRAAACRSASEPAPGDADAGRERRRAALQARGQLGPGHDPRLPGAARRRGARPHAAGRPVPAGAARALPAHVRRRRRATTRCEAAGPAAARARRGDRRRPPLARPRRAAAGHRGRGSAASCGRSSAPACAYALEARRLFIADEQGLGKTVEALADAGGRRRLPGGRRLPGVA